MDLSNATLINVIFTGATVDGANFSNVTICQCDIEEDQFVKVKALETVQILTLEDLQFKDVDEKRDELQKQEERLNEAWEEHKANKLQQHTTTKQALENTLAKQRNM